MPHQWRSKSIVTSLPSNSVAEACSASSNCVSAVIVNFNAGAYLATAVLSVLSQGNNVGEVIVVDNDSEDSSLSNLHEISTDPRLRVIKLDANNGFARACNIGIEASRGGMVLLLNPDCYMFPGSLEALLAGLGSDPTIAAAGPLLMNSDGTEQRGGRRDIPNPWQIFCYTIGLHRLMPRHPRFRNFNQMTAPLPSGPIAVPAISGACMLIRRSAIDGIGGFDERYFMHFEDLDWCLRVTQKSQGIRFVPAAIVEHTQGVCSAGRPLRVEYYKHRSLIEFLSKNFSQFYPRPFITVVRLLVNLHLGVQILRTLIGRTKAVDPPRRMARTNAEDL